MTVLTQNSEFVKSLVATGLIPPWCTKWELILDPSDVIRIRCEVLPTDEELAQIQKALEANVEELRQVEPLIRKKELE